MLVTGMIVGYGYVSEAFFGWYSANKYEGFMIWNRMSGPYAPIYWALIFCNIIMPQFLWIRRVRTSTLGLFCVAMVVNVGMWLERFVIVVTSLHRDFLPSSWGMYYPTIWDWMTFIGTIGLFLTLFFLFIRFLPMISIFEMRTMAPEAKVKRVGGALMATAHTLPPAIYGLMAEFDDPTALVAAAKRTYAAGYREDRHVLAVSDRGSVGGDRPARPAAVADRARRRPHRAADRARRCRNGCTTIAYPINIAGKPLNSWPQFIPVTFELTILFAALSGGDRDDPAERAADAVSPGVQRGALRAREPGQVLPAGRVDGPEVRSGADARLPQGAQSERGQ